MPRADSCDLHSALTSKHVIGLPQPDLVQPDVRPSIQGTHPPASRLQNLIGALRPRAVRAQLHTRPTLPSISPGLSVSRSRFWFVLALSRSRVFVPRFATCEKNSKQPRPFHLVRLQSWLSFLFPVSIQGHHRPCSRSFPEEPALQTHTLLLGLGRAF